MPEYINRESAIARMNESEFEIDLDEPIDPVALIESVIDTMLYCVRSETAADVVPVVHGRWEDGQLCSSCSFDRSYFRPYFNYCPNCGARMDGDDT